MRFFYDRPDVSESPIAYKSADQVRAQIERFGLADVIGLIMPKGSIMALPRGATAVDFAYAVHTDIGNRCVAVKINDELMPLRTELRNGDRVEIITASHAKPNPMWLNYVITGRARAQIRHFLKTVQYEESAHLGERLLNQALGTPDA
mgnify:CR=1 FL=1